MDATRWRTAVEGGRRCTRREELYAHTVGGLASGVCYEFRVAAESTLGRAASAKAL